MNLKIPWLICALATSFLLGITTCLVFFKWPLLSSMESKGSYAIGQQMGQNFKRHHILVSERVIAAAITDALSGQSRLSESELRSGIDFIHERSRLSIKSSQDIGENEETTKKPKTTEELQ